MRVRLFFLSQGGYDTHSQQLNQQQNLLTELGGALAAFQQDLEKQKLADYQKTLESRRDLKKKPPAIDPNEPIRGSFLTGFEPGEKTTFGKIENAAAYSIHEGRTVVPLRFDPAGSVFVVFRKSNPGDNPITSVTRAGQDLLAAEGPVLLTRDPVDRV